MGCLFPAKSQVRKVDAVYSSMHFERVFIPDEYTGTPGEAFQHLEQAHADVCRQLSDLETQMQFHTYPASGKTSWSTG